MVAGGLFFKLAGAKPLSGHSIGGIDKICDRRMFVAFRRHQGHAMAVKLKTA